MPEWVGKAEQLKEKSLFNFAHGLLYLTVDFPGNGIGNYNVHINLSIENNDLFIVKKELGLSGRPRIYLGGVNLIPDDNLTSWFFLNNDNNDDDKLDNILSDIDKFYFPLAYDLLFDYFSFYERLKKNPRALLGLRDPFTTISIMLFYIKKEPIIYDELIPLIDGECFGVNTKSIFYDYHNCTNPEVEIIEPIRAWFVKNERVEVS